MAEEIVVEMEMHCRKAVQHWAIAILGSCDQFLHFFICPNTFKHRVVNDSNLCVIIPFCHRFFALFCLYVLFSAFLLVREDNITKWKKGIKIFAVSDFYCWIGTFVLFLNSMICSYSILFF